MMIKQKLCGWLLPLLFCLSFASFAGDTLKAGATMKPGENLVSKNGQYQMSFQTDSNLVVYQGSKAIWASNTPGMPSDNLAFQTDGNLVIYYRSFPIWASGISGNGYNNAYLVMQDDGILAAYNNGSLYWSTKPKSQTSTPTTNSNPTTTSTTVNVSDFDVAFCVGACPTGKTGCVLSVNKDTARTECGTVKSGEKYSANLIHTATNTWTMQILLSGSVCNIFPGSGYPQTASLKGYYWGIADRFQLVPLDSKGNTCQAWRLGVPQSGYRQ